MLSTACTKAGYLACLIRVLSLLVTILIAGGQSMTTRTTIEIGADSPIFSRLESLPDPSFLPSVFGRQAVGMHGRKIVYKSTGSYTPRVFTTSAGTEALCLTCGMATRSQQYLGLATPFHGTKQMSAQPLFTKLLAVIGNPPSAVCKVFKYIPFFPTGKKANPLLYNHLASISISTFFSISPHIFPGN